MDAPNSQLEHASKEARKARPPQGANAAAFVNRLGLYITKPVLRSLFFPGPTLAFHCGRPSGPAFAGAFWLRSSRASANRSTAKIDPLTDHAESGQTDPPSKTDNKGQSPPRLLPAAAAAALRVLAGAFSLRSNHLLTSSPPHLVTLSPCHLFTSSPP
jgi:hypothetical protein